MDIYQKYLEYISNAGKGATVENFIDDWKPSGEKVLNQLKSNNLITIDDNNRIHLTDIGKVAITT